MTDQEKKILQQAINKFGPSAQYDKAVEELAECIVAIRHFAHLRNSRTDLASEVADVEIMMEQVRLMIGEDLVDAARAKKLARLELMAQRKDL